MFPYRDLESLSNSFDFRGQENDFLNPTWKERCTYIDLIFRILFNLAMLAHYIYQYFYDPVGFNHSKTKITGLSCLIALVGIQHCSVIFYPWIKQKRFILFSTFILLLVFITMENKDRMFIISGNEGTMFWRMQEFLIFMVLMPNVTLILFIIFLFVILMIMFVVLNVLARLGVIQLRIQQPMQRLQNRANKFKEKYLNKLKGNFYGDSQKKVLETKSLLGDDYIRSDDLVTIYRNVSVNHAINEKYIKKKKKMDEASMDNGGDSMSLCSICFGQFENHSYILTLPVCEHTFHFGCIKEWLQKNPNCPCCRSDLLDYFEGQNNNN